MTPEFQGSATVIKFIFFKISLIKKPEIQKNCMLSVAKVDRNHYE